jgi:hypothetical protein
LPQLQSFLGLEEIRHLVELVFALADVLDFDDDRFSPGLEELEHVVHESFYFGDEAAVAVLEGLFSDTSKELEELLEVASLVFQSLAYVVVDGHLRHAPALAHVLGQQT